MQKLAYPQLSVGLVGAWRPSAGATGFRLIDRSGRGNHGVLTNMDPATDWVASGGAGALDFDGTNDRVECGSIQSFTGDCTWLCWFRHTATGSDQCLITTRNILTGASRNGLALYIRGGGFSNIEAEFVVNGNRFTATVNGATQDGIWRLAVARRIAGRTFLDVVGLGQATSSGTSTATITHEVGVSMGLWRDYATGAFSVQIDDARIYDRALTDAEIKILATRRGIADQPKRLPRRFTTRILPAKYAVSAKRPAYAYPELWRGCVGAWAPNQGSTGFRLLDRTRQNNHGTLTNMDAATDWVVSGGQMALDFDGVDDWVNLGTPPSVHPTTMLSISAWCFPRSSAEQMILASWTAGSGCFALVSMISGFYWFNNSGSQYRRAFASAPDLNQWNHLAVTVNATSGEVNLYKNGVLSNGDVGTPITGTFATQRPLGIGRLGDNSYGSFSGMLDDLRMYHRVLAPAEIRLLATRRGIAYQRRKRRYAFAQQATGKRRRLLLTGQT